MFFSLTDTHIKVIVPLFYKYENTLVFCKSAHVNNLFSLGTSQVS
jgi:hypothetical protein